MDTLPGLAPRRPVAQALPAVVVADEPEHDDARDGEVMPAHRELQVISNVPGMWATYSTRPADSLTETFRRRAAAHMAIGAAVMRAVRTGELVIDFDVSVLLDLHAGTVRVMISEDGAS